MFKPVDAKTFVFGGYPFTWTLVSTTAVPPSTCPQPRTINWLPRDTGASPTLTVAEYRQPVIDGDAILLPSSSGLRISKNRGQTFRSYTQSQGLGSNDITQVAARAGIWAAATANGVAVSLDQGATFTSTTRGLSHPFVTGVAVADSGKIFALTISDLWKGREDAGPCVCAAVDIALDVSTDRGQTYKQVWRSAQKTGIHLDGYAPIYLLRGAQGADRLFLVLDQLYTSIDEGKTFATKMKDAATADLITVPKTTSLYFWRRTSATDTELTLFDFGVNSYTLTNASTVKVGVVPAKAKTPYGLGVDRERYFYTDSLALWRSENDSFVSLASLNNEPTDWFAFSPNMAVAVGYYRTAFVADRAFDAFTKLDQEDSFQASLTDVHRTKSGHIYVGGAKNTWNPSPVLHVSKNDGETFQSVKGLNALNPGKVFDIASQDGKIMVATNIGLAVSKDNGVTFVMKGIAAGISSRGKNYENQDSFLMPAVTMSGANDVYLNLFDQGIAISHDGGETFVTRPVLNGSTAAQTMGNVAVIGGKIYVGSYDGLFISSDDGVSFKRSVPAGALYNAKAVNAVATFAGKIFAGTSNGLYLVSPTDGTMTPVGPAPLPPPGKIQVQGVFGLVADDKALYVAQGGGISKSCDGESFTGYAFGQEFARNAAFSNVAIDPKTGSLLFTSQSGLGMISP